MLSAELMRAVRRIEIRTRHLVANSFAGEYHAIFKGRGIEFDEVRPYQPGDEVRSIDWNVTARMNEPYIKRFVEERELTVMLAIDVSASGLFGTRQRSKRELLTELAAVLAFSAIANNDKVGLLAFSDQIELHIPPRKGRRHVLRLVRDMLAVEPKGRGTDLRMALDHLNRTLKRRAIVFLLSDFLGPGEPAEWAAYERALLVTNRRHDLVAVRISDPRERAWDSAGLVALEDAESGEMVWIDTSSREWQDAFEQNARAHRDRHQATIQHARVDSVEFSLGEDYVQPLLAFFDMRARRWRR